MIRPIDTHAWSTGCKPPPSRKPFCHPDVLDVVVTKYLPTPVHLTACSALSSDHLPVLIDTRCRLSFLSLPYSPDFRRTDWSKVDSDTPFNPEWADEATVDRWEFVQSHSWGPRGVHCQQSTACWPVASDTSSYSGWQSLRDRLRRQCQITRDPTLKAEVNRLCRGRWLQLQEWRNDQWSDSGGSASGGSVDE